MKDKELDREVQALIAHFRKRKLRSDHGLAVLSVVIGKTLASLTQDETETRKILAALHERMLQAAGIDDRPPDRRN